MKKIIVIGLLIIFMAMYILSILFNYDLLKIIALLIITLDIVYIVYKIFRKYRGKIVIDYSKRAMKVNEIKKVSVVIPNYNYSHYIIERINSILEQSYPIYELIILDDKSTDDSVDVINKKIKYINKKYPELKVSFIKNNLNSGSVFKQWQKAFENSKGDYLWICEADDLCEKEFLNVAMQGFDDENVVISYTESKQIDENNKVIKNDFRDWADLYNIKLWNKDFVITGKEMLEKSLCINNSIVNVSGVVFKKIELNKIIEYLNGAQNYKLSGDWFFYYKYLLNGSIFYSADSLNMHRIHSNSVTSSVKEKIKYDEIISIQDDILDNIVISNKYRKLSSKYRKSAKKCFKINK